MKAEALGQLINSIVVASKLLFEKLLKYVGLAVEFFFVRLRIGGLGTGS